MSKDVRQKKTTKKKTSRKKSAKVRVSRSCKPEEMSLEAWQVQLRKQILNDKTFRLRMRNIGDEDIFSEFEVTNPKTKKTYRIAIRGSALGVNYCSCPDFTTNTLGTCKHIEYALRRLGLKQANPPGSLFGIFGEYFGAVRFCLPLAA